MGYEINSPVKTIILPVPEGELSEEEYFAKYGIKLTDIFYFVEDGEEGKGINFKNPNAIYYLKAENSFGDGGHAPNIFSILRTSNSFGDNEDPSTLILGAHVTIDNNNLIIGYGATITYNKVEKRFFIRYYEF